MAVVEMTSDASLARAPDPRLCVEPSHGILGLLSLLDAEPGSQRLDRGVDLHESLAHPLEVISLPMALALSEALLARWRYLLVRVTLQTVGVAALGGRGLVAADAAALWAGHPRARPGAMSDEHVRDQT